VIQESELAWREVNTMLGDAILDHPARIAIVRKIVDARLIERLEWSTRLEAMDRRLEIALAGTAAMTEGEFDVVKEEETGR
jgi:hypothetical protein